MLARNMKHEMLFVMYKVKKQDAKLNAQHTVTDVLTLGGGHMLQYTDDVSLKSTLESIYFLNQCLPDKFNKNIHRIKTEKDSIY